MLGNVFPQKENKLNNQSSDQLLNSLNLEPIQDNQTTVTDQNEDLPIDLSQPVDEKAQIGMSLGAVARPKPVSKLRDDVRRWENLVEVMPYWKIPVFPINLTITIASIVCLFLIIIFSFDRLPNELPLFYSTSTSARTLVDKSMFIVFPVVIAILSVLIMKVKRTIFDFDRRLSIVISLAQIIFNLLLVVAVLQLVSLLLV